MLSPHPVEIMDKGSHTPHPPTMQATVRGMCCCYSLILFSLCNPCRTTKLFFFFIPHSCPPWKTAVVSVCCNWTDWLTDSCSPLVQPWEPGRKKVEQPATQKNPRLFQRLRSRACNFCLLQTTGHCNSDVLFQLLPYYDCHKDDKGWEKQAILIKDL